MDNFDFKKYLAEGKLLKEENTKRTVEGEIRGYFDTLIKNQPEDALNLIMDLISNDGGNFKEWIDGIQYDIVDSWGGDYDGPIRGYREDDEDDELDENLNEGKLFEENDEPFKSKKYIKIDNSEYYVDENGNVKLSLNFPYKFNRSHIYNTPREEYIDKNNWKEKVDPNFPIMKVINNVPTARYEFIEYPSGDKELLVKTNIEDLKKYEDGNYTLK
jgi:hypothetical protein